MNDRSVRERLQDARDYAKRANDLVASLSFSMLKEIDYYDHAVRSYLVILGEALHFVPADVKAAHPQVPWAALWGQRNRIVHGYWRVDLSLVYQACLRDAPQLVAQLDAVIEVLDAP